MQSVADRGVSTTVGTALLLGILVVLGAIVFGGISPVVQAHLHDGAPTADVNAVQIDRVGPNASGDTIRVVHNGGETIDPERAYLRYDNVDAAPGSMEAGTGRIRLSRLSAHEELQAGDVVRVGGNDTAAEFGNASVSVIWRDTDQSYPLVEADEVRRLTRTGPPSSWEWLDGGDDSTASTPTPTMTPIPTLTPTTTPGSTPTPAPTPTAVPIDGGDGGDGGDGSDGGDGCGGEDEDENNGHGNDEDGCDEGNPNGGPGSDGGDGGDDGSGTATPIPTAEPPELGRGDGGDDGTDTPDAVVDDGEIDPDTEYDANITVPGAAYTNGPDGAPIPTVPTIHIGDRDVKPWENVNDGEPHSTTYENVSPDNPLSVSASSDPPGRWRDGNTVHSSEDGAKMLLDGEEVPDVGGGFGEQSPVADFLTPYISDGTATLDDNQAIFLFELSGATDPSRPVADYQDTVVVVAVE
jgi:hypothetical protein